MASVDTYGHISGSRALSGGGEASQATGMGTEPWMGETEACGHPALEPEASVSFLVLPSARSLQLNPCGPLSADFEGSETRCCKA